MLGDLWGSVESKARRVRRFEKKKRQERWAAKSRDERARWVRYNYCTLPSGLASLDMAGSWRVPKRNRVLLIGNGKLAGWCEKGWMWRENDIIGTYLQLYVDSIIHTPFAHSYLSYRIWLSEKVREHRGGSLSKIFRSYWGACAHTPPQSASPGSANNGESSGTVCTFGIEGPCGVILVPSSAVRPGQQRAGTSMLGVRPTVHTPGLGLGNSAAGGSGRVRVLPDGTPTDFAFRTSATDSAPNRAKYTE